MRRPSVSIVVPCYNEVGTVGGLLQALLRQSYPPGGFEIIVADGGSVDGSVQAIRAFAQKHPELELKVIDNPARIIPAGLNLAIAESSGEFVIRLDAHSEPAPDYIERCLAVLEETGAACVGGRWEIMPGRQTWIGRSIATAAGHLLGAGDARYRTGGPAGPVDTVPFGAFPRQWLEQIGQFDEQLPTNEDYEYNFRLREAGGQVWFDPSIRSKYVARGTFRELAAQYQRYGYWKGKMLRRYPGSIRLRQLMPPLFVSGSFVLLLASVLVRPASTALAMIWAVYGALLFASGAIAAFQHQMARLVLGLPIALALMHLSWGVGALRGLASGPTVTLDTGSSSQK